MPRGLNHFELRLHFWLTVGICPMFASELSSMPELLAWVIYFEHEPVRVVG